jgi:hypothetical protein
MLLRDEWTTQRFFFPNFWQSENYNLPYFAVLTLEQKLFKVGPEQKHYYLTLYLELQSSGLQKRQM